MKRILLLVFLSLFICSAVTASSINGDYQGSPIVKVTYDGAELKPHDVPAIIYNDRTMVPLTLLSQAGFNVTWDGSKYTVNIDQPKKWKPKVTIDDVKLLADKIGIIYGYDAQGNKKFQASGFIISPDGLLITANHVIKDSSSFSYGNHTFSTVDFRNSDLDYAGIKLSGLSGHQGDRFKYLPINTKLPNKGDKVFALGYPHEKLTVTEGYITGLPELRENPVIEDSAMIDGGSSGGVLLNEYGEVIAVTVGADEKTKIYDSIPVGYVQKELDKLK